MANMDRGNIDRYATIITNSDYLKRINFSKLKN